MWHRGRVELAELGISRRQWLDDWKRRIAADNAVAFDKHAILGCDWVAEGICTTAFQASTSFEQEGLRITKEMRRAIPGLMQRIGAKEARVHSLCVDPGAPKWFRLLGFEEDMDFPIERRGAYFLRRFVRRA